MSQPKRRLHASRLSPALTFSATERGYFYLLKSANKTRGGGCVWFHGSSLPGMSARFLSEEVNKQKVNKIVILPVS
jgi:hypothetical protein